MIYRDKGELIRKLIQPEDVVLDIGFYGQGTGPEREDWVHHLLQRRAKEVWGIDLEYDETTFPSSLGRYARANAESFSLGRTFDVIFAGDVIEHLSNPGQFLDAARGHLAPGGRLILTTPNTFNLFNLTEKLTKDEPTVNPDHTFYFNRKTLGVLLGKNGWKVDSVGYLYTLGALHEESWKKKLLNVIYGALAQFTPKFVETLVVVAQV